MTISEVSKKYDISPATLRYYEREGLAGRIEALRESLERLDRKIAYYEECSKGCCD